MKRRDALSGVGTCVAGLIAGCLGETLDHTHANGPRLVGVQVGNWYPDPQTLNVLIEGDGEVLYERQVQLPGGDPSEYDRPSETLEGHPSELPPSAMLSTWVDGTASDEAKTLDIGERSTECIGIDIDICPECGDQKGQDEFTIPEVPDTLIKTTSNCNYLG